MPFQDHAVLNIAGINWVDSLEPFIERKLYTVNTGHATAAYHGYNRKKRTVCDALHDRHIRGEVEKTVQNTARLITTKHGIHENQQAAYVKKIITRIDNPHLENAVDRVGRASLRKLGPQGALHRPGCRACREG